MKQFFLLALLLLSSLQLTSCATDIPASFSRGNKNWIAIEVRKDMDYDKIWFRVFDVIAKELDITLYSKEQGYIQTQWHGGNHPGYQTRIKLRFSEDKKLILFRTEARMQTVDGWMVGVDTQQLKSIYEDITGLVSTVLQ